MNSVAIGYLIGTFLVPFILGWIFTKKWYWGLVIGMIGLAFQVTRQTEMAKGQAAAQQLEDQRRERLWDQFSPKDSSWDQKPIFSSPSR